jgi:heme/copper-type cytochrome/quinol oxidase subunit 1
MLFVLAWFFNFFIGGVSGVFLADAPSDVSTHGSFFVMAHFHYTIMGGLVFAFFAAIYYWVPKIHGRMLSERLGRLAFWLIFVGFNLTFFPMHISGLLGMPRRVYTYQPGLGWDLWNLLSSIGGVVLSVGILVVLVDWIRAVRVGPPAGPDPWGAPDLEWATSSPPPHYNFLELPVVRSAEPLWDQPELVEMGRRIHDLRMTLAAGHDTIGTSVVDADRESVLAMPEDTPVPLATALAIAAVFVGALTRIPLVMAIGGAGLVGALLVWLHPQRPDEHPAGTPA